MTTARSAEQIARTVSTLNGHTVAVAEAIASMSGGITEVGDAAGGLRQVAEQQFSVVATLNKQVDDTLDRVLSLSSVTDRLEQRRHPRVSTTTEVQLVLNGRSFQARLMDISQAGLRCSVTGGSGVHAGQRGKASFTLKGKPISLNVQVKVRFARDNRDEIGLEFAPPAAETAAAINRYLSGIVGTG